MEGNHQYNHLHHPRKKAEGRQCIVRLIIKGSLPEAMAAHCIRAYSRSPPRAQRIIHGIRQKRLSQTVGMVAW
jgi:hypothetical protein